MNRSAIRVFVAGAFLWIASALPVLAQSTPNWTYGYVPTQEQWSALFASKQDVLGYTPLNQAGGTMVGRLITAAPSATISGFNMTPGSTPSAPVNGDMWVTASGVFVRVNGSTISIGASSGSVTSVGLALPGIFSVSGSPVTLTGTLTGTLVNQNANVLFAGPVSGGAGTPGFRSLVNADFPSGFVVAGTGLTGGSLAGGGTVAIDKATSANFFAGTTNKVLTSDIVYTAETTTTFGTTTTFAFDTFINTAVTLTGNITTQSVSGVIAGKAGTIRYIQDGAGNHTTVWNAIFKWPGGAAPTLSTAANAVDALNFNCISAAYCQASLAKAIQ